ncbi:MAG: MerR family transcriptional regulator [Cellulosilyticaceae bacterium]
MKNSLGYFTTGEFAKLHHLNRRTLHYYDTVGIFSPKHTGTNGYRYYTYEQSIELENILALRELGMSIEEISHYIQNPNPQDFQRIASAKLLEIQQNLQRLTQLQSLLTQKSSMLTRCSEIYHGKIELVTLDQEYLLMTPLPITFQTESHLTSHSPAIMEHLRAAWELSAYKKSCGSYISLDKIKQKHFCEYDGIFSTVDAQKKDLHIRPKGLYIRGFSIGDWNNLPLLYENILAFADQNHLILTGYAFECGLNEFAISREEDYVTQVEILCLP